MSASAPRLAVFFLEESFHSRQVAPQQMDALWAEGWRHFGTYFFRYSVTYHGGKLRTVMPLRVDLTRFALSRSQKRVLAKNRDLEVVIRETVIDADKEALFFKHVRRLKENVPTSVYDFLSRAPASLPCVNHEICVYLSGRLLAASFLDVGEAATSAVYAMFDPDESRRSLGIFTMLEAMRYSRAQGCRYYYPGYAYREPSFYDYKKGFFGLEYLHWGDGWRELPRNGSQG